jgi:cytochrome c-type biogenesis protein CcmH
MAPNAPDRAELEEAIAQAESKLPQTQGAAAPRGGAPAADAAAPAASAQASRSGDKRAAARITGRVVLAPGLAARVSPDDTVFIYATPAQGSRMPLAVVRTTVSKLPFNFVLDESSAMGPQATLASQSEVTLRARISSTGEAMPKPGELGVMKTPVKVGASGLELKIEGPMP